MFVFLTRQARLLLLVSIALWLLCNHLTPEPHPHPVIPKTALRYLASGWNNWISHAYWLTFIEQPFEPNEDLSLRSFERVLSHSPANRFFRIQSAGMIAFDLPSTLNCNEACAALASVAIQVLSDGIDLNRDDAPYYYYEIGKIQLLKLNDREMARQSFQAAAQIQEISQPVPPAP